MQTNKQTAAYSAGEVVKRIKEWLGKYGKENTSSLLLYEAMQALEGVSAEAEPKSNGAVTAVRMGYGTISYGGCASPELGEPGIVFMQLDDPREIGAPTVDLFPIGSRAPANKVLAYITFKDAQAVDNVIACLHEIKDEHFPGADAAAEG